MYFHSKGLAYSDSKQYVAAIEMFEKSLELEENHREDTNKLEE